MIKRILSLPPLLAAMLLGACAAGTADDRTPPEWLIGSHQYSGSGVIAKKFPWRAEAVLVLDRDRRYTLTVTGHIEDDDGGDSDTDESYGSYEVRGDRVVLFPVRGDEFDGLLMQNGRLVLHLPWPARLVMRGFRVPAPVFVKTDTA